MGSIDQQCSSPSFIWSVYTIWMPGINFTGRHPGHGWPYGSFCAWCILLTPLGLTPTWALVLSCSTSLHGVIVLIPIQCLSTQYSFHISGNRGYDSNRVRFAVSVMVLVLLQGRKFTIRADGLHEKKQVLYSLSVLHAKNLLQHISNSHRLHLNTKPSVTRLEEKNGQSTK